MQSSLSRGKKGDLQKAIREAVELWIKNPTAEKLKDTAMNARLLSRERERAMDELGRIGSAAIPALAGISYYSRLVPHGRGKAIAILKEQKLS